MRQRVKIEFDLLNKVNDTFEMAEKLIKALSSLGMELLVKDINVEIIKDKPNNLKLKE